jgi:hypothetical protein
MARTIGERAGSVNADVCWRNGPAKEKIVQPPAGLCEASWKSQQCLLLSV